MTNPLLYPGQVATDHPDRAAVVMAATGQSITFADLDAFANRLSQLLRAIGLKRGDHIALCIENRLEFLPIIWGCHYAGLYYTPISSRLNSEEITYIINDCGATAFIGSIYKASEAIEAAAATPGVTHRFSVGGPIDGHEPLEEAVAGYPPTALRDRREAVEMLYSAGTTGRPKGVKPALPDAPLGEPGRFVHMARDVFGSAAPSSQRSNVLGQLSSALSCHVNPPASSARGSYATSIGPSRAKPDQTNQEIHNYAHIPQSRSIALPGR